MKAHAIDGHPIVVEHGQLWDSEPYKKPSLCTEKGIFSVFNFVLFYKLKDLVQILCPPSIVSGWNPICSDSQWLIQL